MYDFLSRMITTDSQRTTRSHNATFHPRRKQNDKLINASTWYILGPSMNWLLLKDKYSSGTNCQRLLVWCSSSASLSVLAGDHGLIWRLQISGLTLWPYFSTCLPISAQKTPNHVWHRRNFWYFWFFNSTHHPGPGCGQRAAAHACTCWQVDLKFEFAEKTRLPHSPQAALVHHLLVFFFF